MYDIYTKHPQIIIMDEEKKEEQTQLKRKYSHRINSIKLNTALSLFLGKQYYEKRDILIQYIYDMFNELHCACLCFAIPSSANDLSTFGIEPNRKEIIISQSGEILYSKNYSYIPEIL